MFTINDDLSIYVTRGDRLFFTVTAVDDGKPYVFQPGDIDPSAFSKSMMRCLKSP